MSKGIMLTVLLLEDLLFAPVALAISLKFLFSPRRGVLRGLLGELRERFAFVPADVREKLNGKEVLWFHAASAGEVNAMRPLIAALKRSRPAALVLTTTLTRAGRDRALTLPEIDVACLAPFDCTPPVRRFFLATRPRVLILVETELWPHLLACAPFFGVKLALVNGRISERSFWRYRLIAPFLRPFLAQLAVVAAQTEADAGRFRALGAVNVVVVGNLKYDASPEGSALLRIPWSEPFVIAASTHPGEEEAVVDAWLAAKRKEPALKLVLAPRHVERASQAAALLERKGVRYTRASAVHLPADCLLVDRLGLLRGLYTGALACFVGGTLVPVGGHSLIEPALAGVPVVFGPHVEHTLEAARLLESAGAGFRVDASDALSSRLSEFLEDRPRARAQGELARKAAESLQGATRRTIEIVSVLFR